MLGALGSPLDTESITVKWSIVVSQEDCVLPSTFCEAHTALRAFNN